MKTWKLKCIEMEEAVARLYGVRQHIIVPNVSWGLRLHECDLLVIRQSGYAIEVEIKTTIADLKKDAEKRHGHISNKIKELYFAIPKSLYEKALPLIPDKAGIIVVSKEETKWWGIEVKASFQRPAIKNRFAIPLTDAEQFTAARLGCMRIWGLKEKLIKATA